jgi:hypothetical protein
MRGCDLFKTLLCLRVRRRICGRPKNTYVADIMMTDEACSKETLPDIESVVFSWLSLLQIALSDLLDCWFSSHLYVILGNLC